MTEQSQKDDGSATEIEAIAKLDPRERKLLAGIAEGKTAKDAAIAAGYSERSGSSELWRKMNVGSGSANFRQAYRALMDEMGLGEQALLQKVRDGLEAKQYGLTRDGRAVEMGDDWHARAKIMDMAFKLRDAYPNPKLDVNANVQAAVVVIRAEDALAGLDPFAAPQDVTPDPETTS